MYNQADQNNQTKGKYMYKIDLNKNKKQLVISGSGMYQDDELQVFMDEYDFKVSTINPKEYELILDTRTLKTSHQNALPTMQKIMKKYFDTPFKGIFYIKPESAIANSQMKRITEQSSYKSLKIIESF